MEGQENKVERYEDNLEKNFRQNSWDRVFIELLVCIRFSVGRFVCIELFDFYIRIVKNVIFVLQINFFRRGRVCAVFNFRGRYVRFLVSLGRRERLDFSFWDRFGYFDVFFFVRVVFVFQDIDLVEIREGLCYKKMFLFYLIFVFIEIENIIDEFKED